jgi:signal transduction histidine kinase/CheY-like chemotaxis protein
VHGSFGTDEHGQTRDERGARVTVYPDSAFGKLLSGKKPAVLMEEVPLYSPDGVVGRGAQAVAALWNGQQAIGYLSADNLLHGRPMTERHCELLTLYAATIGHLCTRQHTEEALQAADRRKDEFLAMLAHELRNPLAAIQNAMYLIRRRGADETAVPRASEVVERQVRHLARLVDDLLDVSRITHGKIELRKQVVELATVIMEAIEASRPFIESHEHELSVALSPEPVWLEADPTRLEQVLTNLLNNAAKFTAVRGQIGLTAEREGNEVLLRVRDTGIGIPPELLPRVFDLFTQADHSLDRPQGGLGIGLTLVRRLVEMHGGSVRAESAGLGQGSQFVVRLPALPQAHPAESRQVPGTDNLPHPPQRVLVVEDNMDMAETLAELLDLWGYEVRVVYNGRAAMEEASRYQPQVVLLDIGLPGVNGYEVARWLREQAPLKEALLVAVTGYGQEEDRRQAEAAGFDHYLTKPVDPSALEQVLATAADGSLLDMASHTDRDTGSSRR